LKNPHYGKKRGDLSAAEEKRQKTPELYDASTLNIFRFKVVENIYQLLILTTSLPKL
jgi:hypothetical protein